MVKVKLLGTFAILHKSEEIALPTANAYSVAAYLFWQQGSWVRRDLLKGIFWGDCEEERASAYLRQAIYHINKALRDHGCAELLFETMHGSIRVPIRPDIQVDARTFEDKAGMPYTDTKSIEHLTTATSLYRGDFLEGVDYEWCLAERRRLSDTHIGVLKSLVEHLSEQGLFQTALRYAHTWLLKDPLNEAAHRWLIRLYASTGQPIRAIAHFEEFRRVLEEELGVNPSEDTLALYKELGLPECAHAASFVPAQVIGHQRGSRLESVLSKDRMHNACFLVVSGEDMALQGDIDAGMAALQKALLIYERLRDDEAKACTHLSMGYSLLYTPIKPRVEESLTHIDLALSYYRPRGPSTNLCRALRVGADAAWQCRRIDQAAALCNEGLTVTEELNDRQSESSFLRLLGMYYIYGNRMKEAQDAIEKAAHFIPYLSDPFEVVNILLFQGILGDRRGDLSAAERFGREAIRLAQTVTETPRIKQMESYARFLLTMWLHLQDKHDEIDSIIPSDEALRYEPVASLAFLIPMLSGKGDLQAILRDTEARFRMGAPNIPPRSFYGAIRMFIMELIVVGDNDKAARWAGVGIRLTRARIFREYEAIFYSIRAIALAKQGRIRAAKFCLEHARRWMDEGERWTPFWFAWVDGLIAKAEGNTSEAERYLKESIRICELIGCSHYAKIVKAELKSLS